MPDRLDLTDYIRSIPDYPKPGMVLMSDLRSTLGLNGGPSVD